LLEGVSRSSFEPLTSLLSARDEAIELRVVPVTPADEIEWLGPASVQVDTYWQTQFLDAMLGNIQEGRADEDIQDALIAAIDRVWLTPATWFSPFGAESNPIFRLRAFIAPHRAINFTIPAAVRRVAIRKAIETLGDGICYATNVEAEVTHDGFAAAVSEIEMVFVPEAEEWMEGHIDEDDEYWDEDEEDWDEDEEDTEITF
jgi:hypothetical protein